MSIMLLSVLEETLKPPQWKISLPLAATHPSPRGQTAKGTTAELPGTLQKEGLGLGAHQNRKQPLELYGAVIVGQC